MGQTFQIKTAEVACTKPTSYVRYAPGQLIEIKDIVDIVLNQPAFVDNRQPM